MTSSPTTATRSSPSSSSWARSASMRASRYSLYDAAHKFVGHIPGGLAMATVIGATGFKAICGSSAATSATFASVAIPEMDRYGYDRRLSTGIVATVGTLGSSSRPAWSSSSSASSPSSPSGSSSSRA